jgi:hypothetical protein
MRNQTVTVNGKKIVVKEYKIKVLQDEIIPKLGSLFNLGVLLSKETPELPAPDEQALPAEDVAAVEDAPAEPVPSKVSLGMNITEIIPVFEDKLVEFFPELTPADIEESYPSEIEALVEAWIAVNFTGLKKIFKPLLSLAQMGTKMRMAKS